MESTIRGLVLDSSVLVAAERAKLTTPEVLRNIRASADIGDAPIVISAMTVAELAHGIYRADSPERAQQRRQFVDELKAHIPVHPITPSVPSSLFAVLVRDFFRSERPSAFLPFRIQNEPYPTLGQMGTGNALRFALVVAPAHPGAFAHFRRCTPQCRNSTMPMGTARPLWRIDALPRVAHETVLQRAANSPVAVVMSMSAISNPSSP